MINVKKVDDVEVKNEPILEYLKGSPELKELESEIKRLQKETQDVPIIINGKEIRTTDTIKYQTCPSDHQKKIAKFYYATPDIIKNGISESMKIHKSWESVDMNEKIKIFLRAADLVSGKYRQRLNASTILGQGKTVIQAEIDAAAELADFFRFNAHFASKLTNGYQPLSPEPNVSKNTFRYRSLGGFVAAISPFNFTAIGGNLSSAPTLMGNPVVWKPSDTAVLSNFICYQLMIEAGFPSGVINFMPADGNTFGSVILTDENLAGINFTGSVATFRKIWRMTGDNLNRYKHFPRLVGECGGKNFHMVHSSADVTTVVNSTIRSAFEYSGQKCSAASRLYVPKSLWPKIREGLVETQKSLKLGSPLDYSSFMSAVIDDKSFERVTGYIKHAKNTSSLEIITGGGYDDKIGYYVEPTIVQTSDPLDKIMREEIFGPVLSVFVYPDEDWSSTLDMVRDSTPYALTGAIFGADQEFLRIASDKLLHAAGNFYINDKSTGSVVGQQPFGGSKLSGTNDKAGGPHYLLRWASPQNVKETFVAITQVGYPYMNQ